MGLSKALHKTLDRMFGSFTAMGSPWRHLVGCAPWVFLVMGFPAFALGLEPDAASSATGAEHNDSVAGSGDKTQDPFATAEQKSPSAQDPGGVVPATDMSDPFAAAPAASATHARDSRFTLLPLNLIYQGSYIPNVLADQNKDLTVHNVFLDSTLGWTPSGSASLKARVLFEGDLQEAQSVVTEHSDVSGLEYFYEQRFDDQSQTLTLGRKYLGWSSGFQWRPADLIQNGFTTKNLEIDDPNRYLGIDQVRYQINKSGFNIDAVVSNRDRSFYDGIQSAVKLGLSGSPDFSLMYAKNGDYSRKYGVIFDTALPWSTTLSLEAVHIDVDRSRLDDSAHFGRTLESLTGIDRFENIFVSLTKFIDDKRRVDLEFLYDGNGFKNAAPIVSAALAASKAVSAVADEAKPVCAGRHQHLLRPVYRQILRVRGLCRLCRRVEVAVEAEPADERRRQELYRLDLDRETVPRRLESGFCAEFLPRRQQY